MKKLFCVIAVTTLSVLIYKEGSSQTRIRKTRIITGRVTDNRDSAIAYASVQLKGRGGIGTHTSRDGSYQLMIPDNKYKLSGINDSIVFTHCNYKRKTEALFSNTFINTSLQRNESLDSNLRVYISTGLRSPGTKYPNEIIDTLSGEKDDYGRIFTKVEIWAEFPGGNGAYTRWLEKTLTDLARRDSALIYRGPKAVVKIGFTIDESGYINDCKIIKGVNQWIDAGVLNVVSRSPRWKPAMQNGRNVSTYKEIEMYFMKEE